MVRNLQDLSRWASDYLLAWVSSTQSSMLLPVLAPIAAELQKSIFS